MYRPKVISIAKEGKGESLGGEATFAKYDELIVGLNDPGGSFWEPEETRGAGGDTSTQFTPVYVGRVFTRGDGHFHF